MYLMSNPCRITDTHCTGLIFLKKLRNDDCTKFKNELGDTLNYNGFRIESKDELKTVATMVDTSLGTPPSSATRRRKFRIEKCGGSIS